MKALKIKTLFIFLTTTLPALALAKNCDGNTFEINKCLKSQMQKLDNKIEKIPNLNINNLRKYRDKICSDISSSYKGGTYEAVKYGNCVISFDKWFLKQSEK